MRFSISDLVFDKSPEVKLEIVAVHLHLLQSVPGKRLQPDGKIFQQDNVMRLLGLSLAWHWIGANACKSVPILIYSLHRIFYFCVF
jgi:hypothetical protein